MPKKGDKRTGRGRILHSKSRRRLTAKKQAFLDAFKTLWGCVDCGYNLHACALDFDHVRGVKNPKLVKGTSWVSLGWEDIHREIPKCDVRCANCHRVKHMKGGLEP